MIIHFTALLVSFIISLRLDTSDYWTFPIMDSLKNNHNLI